ncbi:ABC transporter substrate-binding protein [Bacillus sp. JJ722]|uniref:ABC transporter substrate-binding protein n=1 Tax=Bacillus sp. JJ722 TaxID=3122973 RepID=UPI002FFD7F56
MVSWKKLISGIAIGTLALSLVACGNDSEDAGKSDKPVELKVATWAAEEEAKEFDALLNELNKEQDDYELKQMVIPKDYYVKIQTMTAGNQAPDIYWLSQEFIPAYAKNSAILDLTETMEKQDEIDMSDYLEGAINTAKYDDKLYGLPWIGQPYVVYYNKTMFKEASVAEPTKDWTWDDFHATAQKLTKDGKYGFAATGTPPLSIFAWGEGGEFIDQDGKVKVNSKESIAGFEKANQILTDKKATMPYQEAVSKGVEPSFVNGEIAMMVGGANDSIEKLVENSSAPFEVGMAYMPAGSKEQVTFNWTASNVVSSQTKNKEVATQAMIDLTKKMFEWKVPTPMKSTVGDIGKINPYKEYAADVIEGSANIARGYHNIPEQNEAMSKLWEGIEMPILSDNNGKGKLNLKKAADETTETIESVIKK